MGTSQPGINGHQNEEDHSIDQGLAALSLSSKTIHADDYLNKGRDFDIIEIQMLYKL
jgi:hypothetical protein